MAARREWPPEDALRWTPRQRQVLDLIARGSTNGQIAEALGISFAGAKWHVSEVISRLGVSSREDAGAYWREVRGLRRLVGRITRGVLAIGAAKVVAGGAAIAAVVVAAIAVIALANGGGSEPGDGAFGAAQLATETATASLATVTATTAAASPTRPASPTPVPTTIVPDGLDDSVVGMIERAGVPLNRVTWVEETVEAENYALTLHGAYADTVRTVFFATARPVNPDAEGVMPWINQISWALVTDASGTEYERGGRGGAGGFSAVEWSGVAMGFPPLPSADAGQGLGIRLIELAGPHEYVWSSWGFTLDLPVFSDTVVEPALPPAAGIEDGEVTFYVDSLVLSANQIYVEWRADGPEERLFGEPHFPGILNPVTPRIVAVGGSLPFGGGGGIGWDRPPGTTHGSLVYDLPGPGDYEIVFGDPETSSARWPFTIP